MELPPLSLPSRQGEYNQTKTYIGHSSADYSTLNGLNPTKWIMSEAGITYEHSSNNQQPLHVHQIPHAEDVSVSISYSTGKLLRTLDGLTSICSEQEVNRNSSTNKLEGYVAGGHVSPSDTHDEQIVVVDDDQVSCAGFINEYGQQPHTIQDAIHSLGQSVTERLLNSSGITRLHTDERSPSPVQVRPPIRRDRTEVGKKQRCLICDTATCGFHFGCVSCAACSAFFRRTIAERREYQCRAEGSNHMKCEINAEMRCYCRACRLQKCLRMGMDPLAVQPHRDMIGQKRKSSTPPNGTPAILSREYSAQDIGTSSSADRWPSQDVKGDTLADHLAMRSRPIKSDGESHASRLNNQPKKVSATATLLTSPNAFAEQLLAFSRTPVISTEKTIPTKKSRLDVSTSIQHTSMPHHAIEQRQKRPLHQIEAEHDDYYMESEYEDLHESTSIPNEPHYVIPKREYPPPPSEPRSMSASPSENCIDVMVQAYGQLWERRRLLYCPDTIRDILGGTQPVQRVATIGERMQKSRLRVEVGLVAEFLSTLRPFAELDLEDKIVLFKHLSISYSILEKHYITMKRGGLQQNRIVHNDNSYTDLSDDALNNLQIESPEGKKCDKETLKRLFITPMRESLKELTGAMYNMKMTDVEFCALVAVILFDHTVSGLADASREQVKQAREYVYRDWFAHYRSRNVADASQIVGNTMLLLPAIQSTAEKAQENYYVVRIFDLFEYDKILDEMMGASSLPDS